MRWFTFLIVAVLMACLQTTLAPRFDLFGVRPDWMFILVVFFALRVPSMEGLFAAWTLGILVDLMSVERLGLMAVAYTLTAILIHKLRAIIVPGHPLAQIAVTALFCAAAQSLMGVYRWAMYHDVGASAGAVCADVVLTAVYTALWAPILHIPLGWMIRLFGIKPERRISRRPRMLGPKRV